MHIGTFLSTLSASLIILPSRSSYRHRCFYKRDHPSHQPTTPALQRLPTMQTGQTIHYPLAQLNGHQGFGGMASLNSFGEIGESK